MTKISLGMNEKPDDKEHKSEQPEENKEELPTTEPQHTEVNMEDVKLDDEETPKLEEKVDMNKILAQVGLDLDLSDETPPPLSIDWLFIKRVSLSQFILAMLSMTLLVVSMLALHEPTGRRVFKMSVITFIGYLGYVAGSRRHYGCALAYGILTLMQTARYMALAMHMIGRLSNHGIFMPEDPNYRRHPHHANAEFDDVVSKPPHGLGEHSRACMFLTVIERSANIAVVITGILGLAALCRGLGRLLTHVDTSLQHSEATHETQTVEVKEDCDVIFD